jgi:hypothetical protein
MEAFLRLTNATYWHDPARRDELRLRPGYRPPEIPGHQMASVDNEGAQE